MINNWFDIYNAMIDVLILTLIKAIFSATWRYKFKLIIEMIIFSLTIHAANLFRCHVHIHLLIIDSTKKEHTALFRYFSI